MSYIGDIALGDTIDVKFTTRAFSTGAPTTLSGGAVAAYPNNSITEITAGISLIPDFDSRIGLNNSRIVATSGNGFAAGTNYALVLTAGTVGGVSVVGEVVGSFSISNRSALRPATAGRTLDVAAAGTVLLQAATHTGAVVPTVTAVTNDVGITQAAADKAWATAVRQLTATQSFDNTGTWTGNLTGSVGSVVGNVGGSVGSVIGGTGDSASIALILGDTDQLQGLIVGGLMTSDVLAISGDVPAADNLEATFDGTGYTNGVAPSTQAQVDALGAVSQAINVGASDFVLTTGSVVSGSITDTLGVDQVYHQLADAAGNFEAYYEFQVGATGIPVSATLVGRASGLGDNFTVSARNWDAMTWENIGVVTGKSPTTDDTLAFTLFARFVGTGADLGKVRIRFTGAGLTSANLFVDQIFVSHVNLESDIIRSALAQGGGTNFIDLDAGASSVNDFYRPVLVRLVKGTGAGQSRRGEGYNGTTKRLTVATDWVTNPDSTTLFELRPWASVRVSEVDVGVEVESNLKKIDGSATGAARLNRSTRGVVLGTVGVGSTATSVVTSSLDPASTVINQFKGGVVIFDQSTTTAALRGQRAQIISNTAAGVLTVTTLTATPVSGDTFVIV